MSVSPVAPMRWGLVAALLIAVVGRPAGGQSAAERTPAPFESPLPGAPLARPLDMTGGFSEYRIGHFHAGFDFGTGGVVGRPVLAPIDGWVERVRSSGVGYGRSIYLRSFDGRLIQFGHLDAFIEPLAQYVHAAQDSSGQYEQDLWPAAKRFPFRTGEAIAWSGESGAGGPHLHFEIRRGDMAYHPMRAGLAVPDSSPPTLVSLTLEPLDDTSSVARAIGPTTRVFSGSPDTIDVRGRVRATVGARDGTWRGVDRMVPWSIAMSWAGRRTECRFDSVSWATDMVESDLVYDSGRVIGEKGVVLWAPSGFRPRVMIADAPLSEEAGTIVVRPGEPPRTLTLIASDLGGGVAERRVVLRALPPAVPRPLPELDPIAASGPARFAFASFPGGYLRVVANGVPAGSRDVVMSLDGQARAAASLERRGWTAMLHVPERLGSSASETTLRLEGHGTQGRWARSLSAILRRARPEEAFEIQSMHGARYVRVPREALFEDATLCAIESSAPASSGELESVGASWSLEPAQIPLRKAVRVGLAWPESQAPSKVALYRKGDGDWAWVGDAFDPATRRIEGDSRRLGEFALFRDATAPRVTLRAPPARAALSPYSRWALEAAVTESGSGLNARGSYLEIDGRRVPSEWDPEKSVLRWRPVRPPASGTHRVRVVAADRAGNVSSTRGSFERP